MPRVIIVRPESLHLQDRLIEIFCDFSGFPWWVGLGPDPLAIDQVYRSSRLRKNICLMWALPSSNLISPQQPKRAPRRRCGQGRCAERTDSNQNWDSPRAVEAEVPANALHLHLCWGGGLTIRPLVPQRAHLPSQRGRSLLTLTVFSFSFSTMNFCSQTLSGPSSVRCVARRMAPCG